MAAPRGCAAAAAACITAVARGRHINPAIASTVTAAATNARPLPLQMQPHWAAAAADLYCTIVAVTAADASNFHNC